MPISAVKLDTTAVDVTVTEDRIIVVPADGRELAAPLAWFPRLADATADQRRNWRRRAGIKDLAASTTKFPLPIGATARAFADATTLAAHKNVIDLSSSTVLHQDSILIA